MKKRYFMLLAAITIAGYAMAALFTDVYVYEYMKGSVYTLITPTIRAGSTIDAKPFNADYVTIGGYSYSGTNKAYHHWFQRINGKWEYVCCSKTAFNIDPQATAIKMHSTSSQTQPTSFSGGVSASVWNIRIRQIQKLEADKTGITISDYVGKTFSQTITINYASLAENSVNTDKKPIYVVYSGVTGDKTLLCEPKIIGSETITISGTITTAGTTTANIKLCDNQWQKNVYITIPVTITGKQKSQGGGGIGGSTSDYTNHYVGDQVTVGPVNSPAGLPLTYTITDGADCGTLNGNLLTGTKAGTVVVTASNEGNAEYLPYSKTYKTTFVYHNEIVLERDAATIEVGDSVQIVGTVSSNATLGFEISNEYHAIVGVPGYTKICELCPIIIGDINSRYITALAEGEAVVTVQSIFGTGESGYETPNKKTFTITVVPKGTTTGLTNPDTHYIIPWVENHTIHGDTDMRIFNVTGLDVTAKNGCLPQGIYIVKTGDETHKVIVK